MKKMKILTVVIVLLLAAIIIFLLLRQRMFPGKKNVFTVGEDIKSEDLNDFYYTRSSSTNPAEYLRYRFCRESGMYTFYYEKREGEHFPLTEADITETNTVELTQENWDTFYDLLADGNVEERQEDISSGDDGPYIYLYWKKDDGKFQKYSFASEKQEKEFIRFCEGMTGER